MNEEKNLPVLLTSLKKQTLRDFEVIVSDSGSTDTTPAKAHMYEHSIPFFHFFTHKSKNVSAARNYGANLAKGEFLVFFDADVEVEDRFFEEIKKYIDTQSLDALTVWNRPKTNSLTGKFILSVMNLNMSLFAHIKPAANGPCIIIKKELFEKIKGFDDSIVFGEDFNLIQKAHELGAKFEVFKTPILYVSARRFEKEGLFLSLYKSLKAIAHQLFIGPIRKPIFQYEMGGQYYEDKK